MEQMEILVLLIEDNDGDAGLLRAMLSEDPGKYRYERASTLGEGLTRLAQGGVDIVLLDLSLPDSHGVETIQKVCAKFPSMSIVLLTGLNDSEVGVRAIREGVQDYLVKGQVDATLLFKSIRYAMERKRTELRLLETQKALTTSSKMAALGTMSGGVAHEINNPLTTELLSVATLKAMLIHDDIDKPKAAMLLNGIEEAVKRIAKIVRGLKSFARDAQTDPLVLVSIKSILDDTLLLCETRFRDRGIKIIINIPDNLQLACRATQLSQVFMHLLNNSFDAIQDLPEKWIRVEASLVNEQITISVTDSGKAVSKETAECMFDPFFTTKEIGQGAGLGLSISKGLVNGHNGEIFFDLASPNTRMVMVFPVTSAAKD